MQVLMSLDIFFAPLCLHLSSSSTSTSTSPSPSIALTCALVTLPTYVKAPPTSLAERVRQGAASRMPHLSIRRRLSSPSRMNNPVLLVLIQLQCQFKMMVRLLSCVRPLLLAYLQIDFENPPLALRPSSRFLSGFITKLATSTRITDYFTIPLTRIPLLFGKT